MPLEDVRTVLVEPTHPGNVGAAARALWAMGLSDLALVAPAHGPDHEEAVARAAGAGDALAAASVHAGIGEAIAPATLVLATTARGRDNGWPALDVRTAAGRAAAELAAGGRVAWLFGRESSGLTNTEVEHAHAVVHIPANPDYPVLNLAQAVQIVAWELRSAVVETAIPAVEPEESPAPASVVEGLLDHLETAATEWGYLDPERRAPVERRLRRLLARARPTAEEVNLLRGILRAGQKRARHGDDGVIITESNDKE
ncbi:MAG: RNA methyltransferase [Thiohalospira sp.]